MEVIKPATLDILSHAAPSLSTTSDMPVVETKPDAANKGAPPTKETKDKAVSAPEGGAGETKPEDATGKTDELTDETTDAGKPPRGVAKRLAQLEREIGEGKRIAESERQEKLRLLALLEARGKPEDKPTARSDSDAPVRPNKADFTDPDAYDLAVDQYHDSRAEWKVKAEVDARMEAQAKAVETRQIEEGQKAAHDAHTVRAEKAREKYADYTEVAESPSVQVSIPVAHAIIHSEDGPDIAYYLGKNPAEASRIFALNPALQLVEIGRIAVKLQGPATSVQATVTKAPVTQAPKPGKRLDAGSESSTKSLEEMTAEEYAEVYRNRPENRRRPGMRQ